MSTHSPAKHGPTTPVRTRSRRLWAVALLWVASSALADNVAPDDVPPAPAPAQVPAPAPRAERIVWIRFGAASKPRVISPGAEAFLRRKLERARQLSADVVVVEIDSPGGVVEASLNMAAALRDIEWATTVAYIPREALSGAAIMALGCDQIVMGRNGFIGDAGPIFMGDDFLFRHAPEKIRSHLVSQVRALSKARGRPPAIAEAMVDMNLEVFQVTRGDTGEVTYMSDAELAALENRQLWTKGPLLEVSKRGQFLEVAGAEAVAIGLANGLAETRADVASQFGRLESEVVVLEATWVDSLVTVLNARLITLLLFVVGLVALYLELVAPGIGVGGLIAGLCFGLFFWSRFLGGTAGWLELVLFLGGVSFLFAELFVIPGFGVAGVSGVLLMTVSLIMAGQRWSADDGLSASGLTKSLLVLTGGGLGSIVGMYVVSKYFGGVKLFQHLALEPPRIASDKEKAVEAAGDQASRPGLAVGDEGVADSVLRPAGRARFGATYRDVVTDGSFVERGATVRIIQLTGTHITVREVT